MGKLQVFNVILGTCVVVSSVILLGIVAGSQNKSECLLDYYSNFKGLSWAGLITALVAGILLLVSAFMYNVWIIHSFNLIAGVSLFLLGLAGGWVIQVLDYDTTADCVKGQFAFEIITASFLLLGLLSTFFAKD
eukprot:TRINITY_DN2987_c0_g1_i1.p1 TRINITY_DN2987_c0_g1~~TRINITY_DN2987_c0_g1_i1.p1  ORF type:complete len:134 (-),score=18.43 TRINITY_DN2987_c0_g1_i1:81-482(-)